MYRNIWTIPNQANLFYEATTMLILINKQKFSNVEDILEMFTMFTLNVLSSAFRRLIMLLAADRGKITVADCTIAYRIWDRKQRSVSFTNKITLQKYQSRYLNNRQPLKTPVCRKLLSGWSATRSLGALFWINGQHPSWQGKTCWRSPTPDRNCWNCIACTAMSVDTNW